MLGRLGVPAAKCVFVPFPIADTPEPLSPEPYVYSAGMAQRDWPTLLHALAIADVSAVVAAAVTTPSEKVRVIGQTSPDEGRQHLAKSTALVLALLDTDLPAGPLLVLDAMAAGVPVIASDVGGSRDYVDHGVTGLLVPPNDPAALGAAVRRVFDDPILRARLGTAAREVAKTFTPDRFWRAVLASV